MPQARQSTLGKFLGNKQNGTKPKAQSTLSFNQNPSDAKKAIPTAVNGSSEKAQDVTSDAEMKDAGAVRNGEKDTEDSPSKKNKRRSVESEEPEGEDDDDDVQPPVKRRRRTPPPKASSKNSAKASNVDPKGKPNVLQEKQPPTTTKCNKEGADAPDGETPVSEAEEEASGSEEETPRVNKKQVAKIQATIASSGKDPYPDWTAGEDVPYAALCTTFSLIELTTKRLLITAYCSAFLQQVMRLTPQDLLPTVQLMLNKLAADYAGIELGIGESLIMKAIGESSGRSLSVIKEDHKKIGDLGLVAAKSRSKQSQMFKPKPLTVRGVHQGLLDIAKMEGHGSQDQKVRAINKLMASADVSSASKNVDIEKDKGGPSEAKFLVRFLEGKLRLGLAEKTVIIALAQAVVTHEAAQKGKVPSTEKLAEGEAALKTVYSELPSYEVIIPAMLEHGIFNLHETCKLQPGVPLKPMLAKPTKSITEVLDRFEGKDFTCEYKYDGERAQIHYVAPEATSEFPAAENTLSKDPKAFKGLAAIFSRNSEDLSKKYPDILEKLNTWIKPSTKSFVLDCETVAWDPQNKRVLPFQQLMTRKRKDVKTSDVTVKVCVFAFDMLFYNGEALVKKTLRERRELLHSAFQPVEGEFQFAQYGDAKDIEEIQHLLDDSVKASCEGLMVKMLDTEESGYEPSKRSRNWLKVKKDYLSGVGDSLDLVVLGAYHGKGKRTSWYGAFLLAAYNSDTQTFETVCNIGTGFSEQVLEELHKELSEIVIDRPKPFYSHSTTKNDQPDVWFEARYVWEVKTADLTLSPRYRAASEEMGGKNGISLRFPRFIQRRDDKKTDEATTTRQVAEMYRKQEVLQKEQSGKTGVDDDFEY
ncbi:DNA ligase 1 [Cladophialophora yegresii CBS 114405]|uniref:DNA ligase n=1 Tax=Cladophialophora yegresii CBS 114405 TaxID=1182544 RepID=W9VES8_9EURO|nr:DNA ligase 1 [Cladophialophora yegresii CBS 114405]EXJ53968.1 DNA ligase 1 [Cladophialophora yegresii CBS 114405]